MANASIGTLIREYRHRAQLTQEELAFNAGLNRGYISLLELDQRNPKLETLQKIALALNTPLTTIIFELEFGDE